jgi:hypothetical protein
MKDRTCVARYGWNNSGEAAPGTALSLSVPFRRRAWLAGLTRVYRSGAMGRCDDAGLSIPANRGRIVGQLAGVSMARGLYIKGRLTEEPELL